MNFSVALDRIKWGMPMTRISWGDTATYVYRMNAPDEHQIKIRYSAGTESLWSPTVDDILANDWIDTVREAE